LLRRRAGAAGDLTPVESGFAEQRNAQRELDLPLRIGE
jgi:hypothetical protein